MSSSEGARLDLSRALWGRFHQYAYPHLLASPEYGPGLPSLEQLVRVLSRVLWACHDHRDYGTVAHDARVLASELALRGDRGDPDPTGDHLLTFVELYLKAVLWLVNPTLAAQLRANKGQYTLAPVLRTLELLSQAEQDLSLEQSVTVSDPVRRQILLAYRSRNERIHGPRELAPHWKSQLLQAGLTTLLAPLVKHGRALSAALSGVLIRPIADAGLHALLRITDSERRTHLGHFVARQQCLERLRELVTDRLGSGRGAYLLVTGTEGVGKSALCAKLLSDWPTPQPLGPEIDSVRRLAPWLPAALLVSGKQARLPHEVAGLILAQAQAFCDELLPEAGSPATEAESSSAAHFSDAKAPGAYGLADAEHRHHQPGSTPPDPRRLRRSLYQALERLAEERGPTLLVIDAIDEISPDGELLDFLPESLPAGILALLTTRQGVGNIAWAKQVLLAETWRLDGFERDEIPTLTGIPDDSDAEREWNDAVLKQTQGVPLLITAAVRGAREEGGRLGALVSSNMDAVMMQRVTDWLPQSASGPTPRYKLLLLLALFEPVCALPLAAAQGFLLSRELDLTLHEVRTLLEPVRDQLAGLEELEVRLNLRLFAEYVRDRHLSLRDRRRLLERVTVWLSADEELPPVLLTRFLHYWQQERYCEDEASRRIVDALPDKLFERGAKKTLHEIAVAVRSHFESAPALSERCSRAAAELGLPAAMGWLGHGLVHAWLGRGMPTSQRLEEGALWMRRGAAAGDSDTAALLGSHLLHGDFSEAEPQEAEKWLRRAAAAGDGAAAGLLGSLLLRGNRPRKDAEEGEALLRQAAALKEPAAMAMLGHHLLEGLGLPRQAEEGEKWLRKAAESIDGWSMSELARRLLDGDGLAADVTEGEKWLKQAAALPFTSAMWSLGYRLIHGDKLTEDLVEGERWLWRAVKRGSAGAAQELASLLFNGDKLKADVGLAERLLRREAEAKNGEAMTELGRRLLMGDKLSQDLLEGEKWLRRGAEAGTRYAMSQLGRWLLEGQFLKEDVVEGAAWLRKSAAAGELEDVKLLVQLLIDGGKLKQDLVEATQWMLRLAAAGDLDAMSWLGRQLLGGNGPKIGLEEGEGWLRRAAAAGKSEALFTLLFALETAVLPDRGDTEEWLKKAAVAPELGGEALHLVGAMLYDRGLPAEAAQVFARGFQSGDSGAANDLAYIIRRREAASPEGLSLATLLAFAREKGEPAAHLNCALCLAGGVELEMDWTAADGIIAALSGAVGLRDWWHGLALEGDAEGDLVLGWLVRHGHISDPDGIPFVDRLSRARERGWQIPDWMFEPPEALSERPPAPNGD